MFSKPPSCQGCDLAQRGRGFVLASGPPSAPVLLLGEAPGEREAIEGQPFVGLAGGVLHRLLYLLDQDREWFRIANVLSCQPPANKLAGMPWEAGAISHCSQYLEPVLREGHKVVVAMGATAIRRMLGLTRGGNFAVEDFHGTVTWSEQYQCWVTATFHPSHLQRGAMNLFGTVLADLRRAIDLARGTWTPAPEPSLVMDPPLPWLEAWADAYCAAAEADPEGVWLATDCETPDKAGKDEGELGAKDRSFNITHVNLSCNPAEGVTVPLIEPYIRVVRRVHASPGVKIVWSKYDEPRYAHNGVPLHGPVYDMLDGWHVLHSDVPRGLGFVSPSFTPWARPWKHLGSASPVYRAYDGVNTLVNAFEIAAAHQERGTWEIFLRDFCDWDRYVVGPASAVGVLVDEEETRRFGGRLREAAKGFWKELQAGVPEHLRPLTPKGGWKRDPGKEKETEETFAHEKELRPTLEMKEKHLTKVCKGCGAEGIHKKHRCKDKELVPDVVMEEREVSRWYVRGDFNPGSSPQKLALLAHYGDKPGRNKQSGGPSADRTTLEQRAKHSKSEQARAFYRAILQYQSVHKVKSTYVDATLRRLQADRDAGTYDGRLHPTFTNKPTTMRPSCTAPNMYNVRADKDGKRSLAAGFKDCIVAADPERRIEGAPAVREPCVLVELDWVGQEAVFVGWYAGSKRFIRLSQLGIHDFFNAAVRGEPADEGWDDKRLGEFLKEVKRKYEDTRDPCKRTVHGKDYGLTPHGMHERFPHIFPTLGAAKKYSKAFDELFPEIPVWQDRMMSLADKQKYLGGPGQHPFGYRHEFWDVYTFRRISAAQLAQRKYRGARWAILNGVCYAVDEGADANRVKAFFPQSTNAGELRKCSRRLFHPESPSHIGDAFFGRTPLRAPIYDSFLLELPWSVHERVVEIVAGEMMRPIEEMKLPPEWGWGEFLSLRVDAKIGKTWGSMEHLSLKGIMPANGAVLESLVDEEWEEEEWGEAGEDAGWDWGEQGWAPGGDARGAGAGEDDVPF